MALYAKQVLEQKNVEDIAAFGTALTTRSLDARCSLWPVERIRHYSAPFWTPESPYKVIVGSSYGMNNFQCMSLLWPKN